MKVSLLIINLVSLSNCFKEEIVKTENVTMSVRFKSIKCVVNDSTIVEMNFCFVKAHSRTSTSFSLGAEVLQELEGPLKVSNNFSNNSYLLKIYKLSKADVLFEYRFGTIFRQIFRKTFNYCEMAHNGKLIWQGPVIVLAYNIFKDSLPPFVLMGCPIKKGIYHARNITTPPININFKYLIGSGMYRISLNVTNKNTWLGHGYIQAEVTSPLKFWS